MDENLREATEFPEKNETTAAEADEPKTKSIHFKVSAYDPRGIEQWLSERAAEGKLLLRGDEFVAAVQRVADGVFLAGLPHDMFTHYL